MKEERKRVRRPGMPKCGPKLTTHRTISARLRFWEPDDFLGPDAPAFRSISKSQSRMVDENANAAVGLAIQGFV